MGNVSKNHVFSVHMGVTFLQGKLNLFDAEIDYCSTFNSTLNVTDASSVALICRTLFVCLYNKVGAATHPSLLDGNWLSKRSFNYFFFIDKA